MSAIDRGFEAAIAASELSDAPRVGLKMGACLTSGPRILAIGANLYKRGHPDSRNEFCSTHAEHSCLLRRRHYDGDTNLIMYVARLRSDGTAGCSKPCGNCMELCRLAGVKRIRYTDEHGARREIAL